MFNLFSQSKAQIMLVTSHDLQLFIWQNKTLTYLSSYTDSPDSHALLSQAVVKSSALPVIIITNFMEESFLNETVAHVTGTDRTALLERKLGYAFRTTPYRIGKVTDREKEGRRDDKVLLSALTKPELLKPWIKPLIDRGIPIQSISSVAYLTEAYAQNTGANKEEHLLLVNLERGSELRQTYLKQGKILFSRLTSLASQDNTSLADNIHKESLQIRSYLERIKALPYDEILKVQVYTPINNNELLINRRSSQLNSFENFNTNELAAAYSLELNNSVPSAIVIFLAHTLQKKRMANTYAPFNIRRYFHLNTISFSLKWSASLFILAFILMKIPTLLGTLNNWEQEQQVISQTLPLTTEYDILSQRFPETPIPSTEMALVVETYERIRQQSYMPEQAMGLISQALSSSPDLKITSINWNLREGESETTDQGFGGFGFTPQSVDPANAFQQAIIENRSMLKVQINGLVFSPRSYREAQNQVLIFSEALDDIPGVSVTPLRMPTEVRLDTSVQATVDGEELRAEFILELTLGTEDEDQAELETVTI